MAIDQGAAQPALANRRKITKEVRYAFLYKLEECSNPEQAARHVGVSLSGLRRYANPKSPLYDGAFVEAWANLSPPFNLSQDCLVDDRLLGIITDNWEPIFQTGVLRLLVTRHCRGADDECLIMQGNTLTVQHRIDMNTMTRLDRLLLSRIIESQAD